MTDQIKWNVQGDVPDSIIANDFNRFVNEEAIKINKMIHRDLKKWLKPLPEGYHRYFKVQVVAGV